MATMEGHLAKHILPGFGACASWHRLTETAVQEFVADLKRATFERRKPNGTLIKTYRLSRKTVLNIVGVAQTGARVAKVWMSWELDLGKPKRSETAVLHAGAAEADHRSRARPATASCSRVLAATRVCGSGRRRGCISTTSISTTG